MRDDACTEVGGAEVGEYTLSEVHGATRSVRGGAWERKSLTRRWPIGNTLTIKAILSITLLSSTIER